ncbi:MAG: TolC family protein, partial [Sandaracinaceae bacterium]
AAARARVVEAAAEHAPVVQLGTPLERSAADSWVLFGVAGISFEAFGQERRASSSASADVEGAEVDAEVERRRAAADFTTALHEVEHTRRQLEVLRERLLPTLAAVVARRERSLVLGEGTIFAVIEGRRRLLSARELAVRAEGARTWAEVRMWTLLSALDGAGDAR